MDGRMQTDSRKLMEQVPSVREIHLMGEGGNQPFLLPIGSR